MWSIKETKTDKNYYLVPKYHTYQVGRSAKDISLDADSSVSDLHATFYVFAVVNEFATLEIESRSENKIYLNGDIEKNIPMPNDKRINLKENDRIRFGSGDCILIVQRHKFSVLTSSLDFDKRTKVWRIVLGIGCKIIDVFKMTDCHYTHLTLEEETFTVKLLHALITQKQIVTIEYWKAIYQTIKYRQNTLLPEPSNFRPQCGHSFDMGPRAERENIFHGFVFIFLHQNHMDMYGPLVQLAGGKYKFFDESIDKEYLLESKVSTIVYINSAESECSQISTSLADFLVKNSRRIIPEYEIGLAILSCSTKHYCNSLSKATGMYVPNNSQQKGSVKNANSLPIQGSENSIQKNIASSQTSSVQTDSMSQIYVTETPMLTESSTSLKRPRSNSNSSQNKSSNEMNDDANHVKRVCKSSDKIQSTNTLNSNTSDIKNVFTSKLSLTKRKRDKEVSDVGRENSDERGECRSSENSLKVSTITSTCNVESEKITMSSSTNKIDIDSGSIEDVANKIGFNKKKLCPRVKLSKLNNKTLFATCGMESQVIAGKNDETVDNVKEKKNEDIKSMDEFSSENSHLAKTTSDICKNVLNDNDQLLTKEQIPEIDLNNVIENVQPHKKACKSQSIKEPENVEKNALQIINDNLPIQQTTQATKKHEMRMKKKMEGFIRTKKREKNNKVTSEGQAREEELPKRSTSSQSKTIIVPSPAKKTRLKIINESNNSESDDELFAFDDIKTTKKLKEKSVVEPESPSNDLFNFDDNKSKAINRTEKSEQIRQNMNIKEQENKTTIVQEKQENLEGTTKMEKWPTKKRSECNADIPWTRTKKAANKQPYASIEEEIKCEGDVKECENKSSIDEEDGDRVGMDPSRYRMRVIAYHEERNSKKENDPKENMKYLNKTERNPPLNDQRSTTTKVVNFKKFVRVQHKFLRREIRSQQIAEKLKELQKANVASE